MQAVNLEPSLLRHQDRLEDVDSHLQVLWPWNPSLVMGPRSVQYRTSADCRSMSSSWTQNSICPSHMTPVASGPHTHYYRWMPPSSAGSAGLQNQLGTNSWKKTHQCHSHMNHLSKCCCCYYFVVLINQPSFPEKLPVRAGLPGMNPWHLWSTFYKYVF